LHLDKRLASREKILDQIDAAIRAVAVHHSLE
jgi:hypothetical protein